MELNQFRDVDVVLDKANDNIIQKQFVSAGDKDGRSLTVQITENGVIGEVDGATLNLYWHNEASGLTDLSAFYVVDRATSVFKIDYPQNMLTPGKVVSYIQILHGGKVTHTKPFEITVQNLAGTTRGVLATAEYSALVTTLAKANEFSAQLAQTIQKGNVAVSDINKNLGKFDQTYMSDELLQQIAGNTPVNAVPALYSITQNKLAFPAPPGKYGTKNIFDKNTITSGKYVERSNGTIGTSAINYASDWIPITPSTVYTLSNKTGNQLAFYTPEKVYISGLLEPSTFTTPTTSGWLRISGLLTDLETQQLELGGVKTAYESYKKAYLDLSNVKGNDFSEAIFNSSIGGNFTPSPNLFNRMSVTTGKFVDWSTGLLNNNVNYAHSDFIPVLPSTIYTVNKQYASEQIAFFNSDKVFISGLAEPETFTTPANTAYAIRSVGVTTVNTAMFVLGSTLPSYVPYGYLINAESIPTKKIKGLITVAKENGDFSTISDAVANAGDSVLNPVTILIFPGTYKESVKVLHGRYISLIGVNKDTCIIREDTGDYANNPLRFEGTGRVANLTIMSTVDDLAEGADLTQLYGYAIHSDQANGYGNTKISVDNCRLISYVSAAYGIGLQQDQTIEITNTEMISHALDTANSKNYGALFCHSSNKGDSITGQKLIVKGCTGYADYGKALQLQDIGTGTIECDMSFINNMFYNYATGKSLLTTTKTTGNLSGAINLTPESYGNNITELNAV